MNEKTSNHVGHNTNAPLSSDMEIGQVLDANPPAGNARALEKNFSLLSLLSIGIVTGNVWPALGGSLLASIYNGGAPGVIYEFVAASFCYFTIAAVLAELASALPSSSGVLLWSSIAAGKKHGRLVGYFAGWWNTFAWIFAEASISSICASLCVQIYRQSHPDFVAQPWHNFVCYLLVTWLACAIVCLANSQIPRLNVLGLALILLGVLVTIIVCLSMAATRSGFASTQTVWANWEANLGYPSGFVFVTGMLNGAFAMGTPDATSHLAEEIPQPELNVPKAIAAQYILGFITGFAYLVAILYCINDYAALANAPLPIAEVYRQATGSTAGTTGLLVVILLPLLGCSIGIYVTCGRTLWTLARIRATPFAGHIGHISNTTNMPVYATLASACLVTLLGCIELGSNTAFNAFVSSFILNSTASYMAAVIPYLLQRKNPEFARGPFYMPGVLGWVVHVWACAYMVVWFVVYCFPASLPTTSTSMNYSLVIWVGLTIVDGVWWVVRARYKCVDLSTL